jgi:hypothetical protein
MGMGSTSNNSRRNVKLGAVATIVFFISLIYQGYVIPKYSKDVSGDEPVFDLAMVILPILIFGLGYGVIYAYRVAKRDSDFL